MQHHDDIEAALYRVLVTSLLIAAVAQVFRVAVNSKLVEVLGVLVSNCRVEGVVSRAVVEEKYLLNFFPNLFGNAVNCPVKLVDCVIGNNKDTNSLFRLVGHVKQILKLGRHPWAIYLSEAILSSERPNG